MAVDIITLSETVVITQLLTPISKLLGEKGLAHFQQIIERVKELLNGREAQPVDAKFFASWAPAAALESDETLTEMWARLLASATDPISEAQVQVGFIEVLRQLEPSDTTILNWLYLRSGKDLIAYDEVYDTYLLDTDVFNSMGYREGRASFENLVRLRLCTEAEAVLRIPPKTSGYKRCATDFGFRFMQACAAPSVNK